MWALVIKDQRGLAKCGAVRWSTNVDFVPGTLLTVVACLSSLSTYDEKITKPIKSTMNHNMWLQARKGDEKVLEYLCATGQSVNLKNSVSKRKGAKGL